MFTLQMFLLDAIFVSFWLVALLSLCFHFQSLGQSSFCPFCLLKFCGVLCHPPSFLVKAYFGQKGVSFMLFLACLIIGVVYSQKCKLKLESVWRPYPVGPGNEGTFLTLGSSCYCRLEQIHIVFTLPTIHPSEPTVASQMYVYVVEAYIGWVEVFS